MIEVQGAYGSAKIFAEIAEESAIKQVRELCDQPISEGAKIRIMPDIHAGAGCTIGTTMTITDKAIPNLVGMDIGCGMETVRLEETQIDRQMLDTFIHRNIPSGFNIRKSVHRFVNDINLTQLYCKERISIPRAVYSIGTLGGGNHFIEADQGEDGSIYIVIHSGSRMLGLQVAHYYQDAAYEALSAVPQSEVDVLISLLKEEGREGDLAAEMKRLESKWHTHIPKALAHTIGEMFTQYMHDMQLTQHFAVLNRLAMMDEIVTGMKVHPAEQFSTIHNYIDTEQMILRKGAVSARLGEKLLIPMNMRDGSLICIGKGNDDWNQSAPHGAGRLMSRSDAKAAFTVDEFKAQMKGIFSTSIGSGTLDECPMAYKPMDAIVGCIADTVEIQEIIHPIYNFKASS